MQNLILVATQVGVLFALMAFGGAARRFRLVGDRAIEGFANLLMIVITPCVIVDSFQRPFESAALHGLAAAFALAVGGHLLVIALAYLCVRHRDSDTCRPLRLAAVFSNAGFIGIPLEQAVLGADGVFYGVVYVVVFNLFIWSWGLKTMSGTFADRRAAVMKMVFNPGTIGLAIALPLYVGEIALPGVLATSVRHMANVNTPLAMIVIGYSLAGAKLGKVLADGWVYVAAAIRLIAYPLLMIGVLWLLRAQLDRNLMLALTIAASAPVAAMVSMFAVKFRRDVDTAVAVVSGTTLLSIVTMPLLIAFAMEVL